MYRRVWREKRKRGDYIVISKIKETTKNLKIRIQKKSRRVKEVP